MLDLMLNEVQEIVTIDGFKSGVGIVLGECQWRFCYLASCCSILFMFSMIMLLSWA